VETTPNGSGSKLHKKNLVNLRLSCFKMLQVLR
jgi:hypothetical protein